MDGQKEGQGRSEVSGKQQEQQGSDMGGQKEGQKILFSSWQFSDTANAS